MQTVIYWKEEDGGDETNCGDFEGQINTEKSLSLHMIYLKNKNKFINTLFSISIEYIFLCKEIRYLIPPTINTHIDCLKVSKSVYGALSKQQ